MFQVAVGHSNDLNSWAAAEAVLAQWVSWLVRKSYEHKFCFREGNATL